MVPATNFRKHSSALGYCKLLRLFGLFLESELLVGLSDLFCDLVLSLKLLSCHWISGVLVLWDVRAVDLVKSIIVILVFKALLERAHVLVSLLALFYLVQDYLLSGQPTERRCRNFRVLRAEERDGVAAEGSTEVGESRADVGHVIVVVSLSVEVGLRLSLLLH